MLNGHAKGTRATIKGTTFTSAGGGVCHTVGTYKIKLSGTKLTFSVIKDSCKVGRKLVLLGHTLTKIG